MFTRKDLVKLIIPLIIEQILAVTIGMADTIMVASIGEAAVSGVSLVDTINILVINILAALATGGAIVSSQYLGREDKYNAGLAGKQLILSTAFLSAVVMLICLIANGAILSLLFGKVEPAVMQNCQIYFYWTALSYPFIAIYNSGAALFRAMGNSRVSMFTSIIMNTINISGNAICIYGLKMGVAGAAIPTLTSRVVGAVAILFLLRNHNNKLYVDRFLPLDIHPKMIRNILKIGIPNGLENGMFQIGKILVQGLVAALGTVAIAANAVANSVCNFAIIPGMAIGLSIVTVVGQCVGAKDYIQARRYTIKLTAVTYGAMAVFNLVIALLAPVLVAIFQMSGETALIAEEIIFYHSIACAMIWPMAFTVPNGLRAAGDVKYTMIISIISMWVFRIGCSYLIHSLFHLGVLSVWIAMFIDWVFRGIMFMIRFHSNKWETARVIE